MHACERTAEHHIAKETRNEIAVDPLMWLLSAPLGGIMSKTCRKEGALDGDREQTVFDEIHYVRDKHYLDDHRYTGDRDYFAAPFNGLECGKATVSGERASHTLAHFIACFIYSSWHGVPFSKIASHKKKSLAGFTTFVNDILRVTTLQLSVILLSLKLVLHLKSLKPNLNGAEGSEFRLLVCTLMLSMKLLVDNTYTNFTWQKVSRIPLDQINTVEVSVLRRTKV